MDFMKRSGATKKIVFFFDLAYMALLSLNYITDLVFDEVVVM